MKKIFLILGIFLLFLNSCEAKNIYLYQNQPQNSYFEDIDALEKYSFDKVYSRENDLYRLQRLEMQAFGAIQQGDIVTRYNNAKTAILSRPKQNQKNSLVRGLSNYFIGQMTGYTPPMYSSPYSNDYTNNRYYKYGSPFHKGYRYNDFSNGTSSAIKILD